MRMNILRSMPATVAMTHRPAAKKAKPRRSALTSGAAARKATKTQPVASVAASLLRQAFKSARLRDIVLVKWEDSHTLGDGWQEEDDAMDRATNALHIQTVGFISDDKPEYLLLSQSHGGGAIAEVLKIPRKSIRDLRKLGKITL